MIRAGINKDIIGLNQWIDCTLEADLGFFNFMEEEIWRDIQGYEGYYQVSNWGRVKSVRFKNGHRIRDLKPHLSGYYYIKLCVNYVERSLVIHRIVALHFLPLDPDRPFVNHIDGDRTNNHISNLEWVTNRENVCYFHNKTSKYSRFTGVTYSKINDLWISKIMIRSNSIHIGAFKTEIEAANAYKHYCDKNGILNKYRIAVL